MRSSAFIACDTYALLAYQQGTASPEQRDWLESHLSTCRDCRSSLESDAANNDFWQSVKDAFKGYSGELTEFSVDTQFLSKLDSILEFRNFELSEGSHVSKNSQRQILENLLKARLEPVEDGSILGRLGKYDIECIIAHGGMGLVLKAIDHDLGREVAIKTLLLDRTDDISARQRLLREAKAVALLHHPNIIQIYSVEFWQDLPLIVMPFITGQTLQHLGASSSLSIDTILVIARQLAAALVAAHQADVIHRDIKPSNVLLQDDASKILLSDFGLARIGGDHTVTQTGNLAGTPQFMSPEQAQGLELSDRTDIFSLGSVLYWLCTKAYPFDAVTPYAILIKLVHDSPAAIETHNQQVPPYLVKLIAMLMAKDPIQRPDASQTLTWIDECIAFRNSPRANSTFSFMPVAQAAPPSKRRIVLAAIVVLSVVGLFSVLLSWQTASRDSKDAIAASVSQATQLNQAVPQAQLVNEHPVSPAEKPEPNLRYGELDTIDVSNMLDDLNSDQNVLYWLRRLAYLPANDIPPKCITNIEEYSRSSNSAVRELALVILSKNPFEEITPYQTSEVPSSDENPFVEIDPSELNSKN